MKTLASTIPLLAAVFLAPACNKQDPASKPPVTDPVVEEDPAAAEDLCGDSYEVDAAVDESVLTESIKGTVITDDEPFTCTLIDRDQRVQFSFNDSATDPSNDCEYTFTYTNQVTGDEFSGTQTLDCSNSTLDFKTVGVSENPDCPQVEDDPKIEVKTKNCGNDE